MAKIPTVKLRNRKTGRKAKVDATTYARDIAAWSRDWVIIGTQHGDATDKEVMRHKEAVDLEHERSNDPVREKWSGDKQRVRDQNRVTTGGLVIKPPVTKAVGRPANYRPPSLG
jgi:hypothetical protein